MSGSILSIRDAGSQQGAAPRLRRALRLAGRALPAVEPEKALREAVVELASLLDVRCVLLATPGIRALDTLRNRVVWLDGRLVEPSRALQAAWPDTVRTAHVRVCHTSGVRRRLPDNRLLAELEAESFLAVPLYDGRGTLLGVLAIISDQRLDDPLLAETVVTLFAQRAALVIAGERAAAEATENEAQLAAVIRGADEAVVATDSQFNILAINPAAENLFGHRSTDLRGQSCSRLLPREARTSLMGELAAIVHGGVSQKGGGKLSQGWGLRADGSCFAVTITLLDGHRADSSAYLLVIHDDTRQRAAADALSESDERLRLALDAGAMGIWDWNLQTNDILATPNHAELFSDGKDGFHGSYRTLARRIHPEDRRRFEQTLWKAREQGDLFQHEFRVVWSDGSVRWMNARGRYFFNPEGRAVRLLGLTADITERKRAEEALRQSEELFRGMFEAMTEAVAFHELVYDNNGTVVDYRVISANPAFERHTGIAPGQAVGMSATRLFGVTNPPFLDTFRQVATGGVPTSFAAFFPPLERYFEISVFSTGWGRFVTVFEDNTQRRRLQEEEKLRQEEIVRTAGMITMGEMASAIAHELNQPLTTIATYSEGCLARLQSNELCWSELPEILGEISREAQRAAGVLRSVRKFVQKREFSSSEVAINQLIQRVAQFIETQQHAFGARIRLQLCPGLPMVVGDEILLEIVLLNLVRNGLEAMEHTPLEARELSICSSIDERGRLLVSVRDRGAGVPPDALDEIFGAYVTTKEKGMGLGLAISRSIVETHGGKLTVSGNATGGATFSFSLDAIAQGPMQ